MKRNIIIQITVANPTECLLSNFEASGWHYIQILPISAIKTIFFKLSAFLGKIVATGRVEISLKLNKR